MTLKICRRIPARIKTMEFNWCKKDWSTYTERFKAIRDKCGTKLDHCDWCGHKFVFGDRVGLAQPTKGRNQVLCTGCAEDILTGRRATVDQLPDVLPGYARTSTKEQRADLEAWRKEQIAPVLNADPLTKFKLTCGCSNRFDWWEMYRCIYCGVFYCKTCAKVHFGW